MAQSAVRRPQMKTGASIDGHCAQAEKELRWIKAFARDFVEEDTYESHHIR
jgi:hypothetical protein